MKKILIEINRSQEKYLNHIALEAKQDFRQINSKRLDGNDYLSFILENAHNYIAIIISLIALFKKGKNEIHITLNGGKKLSDLTSEQIKKELANKKEKEKNSREENESK